MRLQIAVVHSEHSIMDMLSMTLDDEGFQPLLCSDLWAACSMIEEAQPHLILLDLELDSPFPQWTLVDQLRANPHTHHIPIVALTTAPPSLERPPSCQHNCELRTEPFDVDELIETVRSLLTDQPD